MNTDDTKKENSEAQHEQEIVTPDVGPLEQCKTERDEYLNGWKRAKADFLNYQKEESKRLEEFMKFASLGLIGEMLPVLDSFDLAIADMKKNGKEEAGIALIRSQLEEALKRQGLERIVCAPGDTFNPSMHESVGETESTHPPGTIAEEVKSGYSLQGRVVRAVQVTLSKSSS